jgi:hypothetical protein
MNSPIEHNPVTLKINIRKHIHETSTNNLQTISKPNAKTKFQVKFNVRKPHEQ